MSQTGLDQEVYSHQSRTDSTTQGGGSTPDSTDWKSLFKHPPSNLRFKRNAGSTRDSKRVVKIPQSCTSPGYTETTRDFGGKIPPPKATTTASNGNRTRREEPRFPQAPPVQNIQLHSHSGSAGSSSTSSMSSSPTSQTSGSREHVDEGEEEDVYGQMEMVIECFGQCSVCELPVQGAWAGCVAVDDVYHNSCFNCQKCGTNLVGENFYDVNGSILCRNDYLLTLDKCHVCNNPITDQVIWVDHHPYHMSCFKCCECGVCLDGVPYVTDMSDKIYCEKDYHKAFAPRCQACQEPILPNEVDPNSKRLIAMNMDFHISCYRCVECGLSLVTPLDSEPQCFPIDEYPLCLDCNKLWSMRRHMSAVQSPSPIKLPVQHCSSSPA